MGCYVLLKSRLVKEIRTETIYAARQYTISKATGFFDGVRYYLACYGCWYIEFNLNIVKHIHVNKRDYDYDLWRNTAGFNEVKSITKCLADCRFDLIYSLMNKI